MSGGGHIVEKRRMSLMDEDHVQEVTRYRVVDTRTNDEVYVMAEFQDDEPELGEHIWWGGEQYILFGENDSKRLRKVGYSWTAFR